MKNRFIGDRAFYRRVFLIAIPIIIQNGITHFVTLLDNIMVGQLGDTQMSGVSVVNQFIFIFNLCIFGANSGPGIFTAQFFGSGDHAGVRHSFRFKFLACSFIGIAGVLLFIPLGDTLISTFLQGEGTAQQIAQTKVFGREYLHMTLWGLFPFAISNVYCSTLRECGQTRIPMLAGISAVLTNLALNWVLIFGNLGMPAMGVRGAALATVVSRYVELAIVVLWTHRHKKDYPFIQGAYRSMHIPGVLLKRITLKGMPLLLNELVWAMGITMLNQCYSTCGFHVVSATNITSTISNLASVVTMALGNTVGILIGQLLGSGASEQTVRDSNRKLTALSVALGFLFGGLLIAIAGVFPKLYNVSPDVRTLSTQLILVIACMKPFHTYMYSGYFTLRSGGKSFITFLYDGGFLWAFTVPLAYILSRFTDIGILPLYILCQLPDIAKCLMGYILIRKGSWIQNLTK